MSNEDSAHDTRITAYQRQLEQLDSSLKNARNELKEERAKIDSLNHTIADLNEQIAIMSDGVTTANSTISSMSSSLSWRVTVPIRKLKRLYMKSVRPLRDRLVGNTTMKNTASGDGVESADSINERKGFDPVFYLKTYPDVHNLYRRDPFQHFIAHGKREGRLGSLPSARNSADFARLDPQRDTVLVVSHEATATGAPVLSLNIILELKKKYNVVSLLLRGGPIVDDFKAVADIAAGPVYGHGKTVFTHQINSLLAACKFRFAIVNSAVSRIVLPLLWKNSIPSVALIHEFAASMRPRDAIAETVFWASEAIFSADIVRQDAIAAFPELSLRNSPVIPQGRCLHFPKTMEESTAFAADQIRRTFRPSGWPDDTPVVLGVGSIHMRKGIDLFVACAARVTKQLRCRFVWIGAGYEPNVDNSYSVYLEDQVSRAGLTDCFAFMDETSHIELAYENANLLVLSSRLDPLPNVCIDAMSRGLPFVCFDKTTGFADILQENGIAKECVAPYLDVDALAACVLRFLRDPALCRSVGNRLREIADRSFDMSSYVDRVEKLALSWVDRVAQENADCATIVENPLLDLDYVLGPERPETSREDAIRMFVRSWTNGWSLRKPYSGFHPGIYRERFSPGNSSDLNSNPLAHFMRAGAPAGPWSYEVIRPPLDTSEIKPPRDLSVALHLHIFYPDLAPVIFDRLNANTIRPDLFISVPSDKVRKDMECLVRTYPGKTREIRVVPNRGRDIGAFITAFGQELAREYEFIGHFHTKKTVDLADSALIALWYSFLLENLIGGRHRMVDVILSRMYADPTIGLVFPDDPHAIGWSNNLEHALKLALQMGIGNPEYKHFNFPIGTMFWARSAAIGPMMHLNLDWKDYPAEPVPYDGSMLHALERLIPFVSEAAGFRAVATNVPGVVR